MADILIKNLKIPKEKYIRVEIHHDGTMYVQKSGYYSFYVKSQDKAIELPPHGRLGDLDLVEEWMRKKHKENGCPFDIDAFLFALRKIPTIVEANNGTDN